MNKIIWLISVFGGIVNYNVAQDFLPKAALTLKAVDDEGRVLPYSRAGIRSQDKDEKMREIGSTDAQGLFYASLPSYGDFHFSSGKDGYYSSWGRYNFKPGAKSGPIEQWARRRWEPWNPTVEVVLKKKVNPIPMYVKGLPLYTIPIGEEGIGYDLETGDWVKPKGTGGHEDLHLISKASSKTKGALEIQITFPGKGNGILLVSNKDENYSELKSSREAPLDGYQQQIVITDEGVPEGFDRAKSHFVFRVRTVLDDQGNVLKAWHGKIYPMGGNVRYYLNTNGTRNLEYDTKRNLFKQTKSSPSINDP